MQSIDPTVIQKKKHVVVITINKLRSTEKNIYRFCQVVLLACNRAVINIVTQVFKFYVFPEAKAYGCFVKLMDRMEPNFPHGTAMDSHLANIQALIQVRL